MTRRTRLLLVAGAVLSAWFVLVLLVWAIPSSTDSVPVGVDETLPAPQLVSVDVRCNSLFDTAARDGSPLPVLKPQPKRNAPLAFQREPCALPHHQARIVFGIDVLVYLLGLAAIGAVAVHGRRSNRRLVALA